MHFKKKFHDNNQSRRFYENLCDVTDLENKHTKRESFFFIMKTLNNLVSKQFFPESKRKLLLLNIFKSWTVWTSWLLQCMKFFSVYQILKALFRILVQASHEQFKFRKNSRHFPNSSSTPSQFQLTRIYPLIHFTKFVLSFS